MNDPTSVLVTIEDRYGPEDDVVAENEVMVRCLGCGHYYLLVDMKGTDSLCPPCRRILA